MKIRGRPQNERDLSDRLATAFVSVFAAMVTLALYPLALWIMSLGAAGGGRVDVAATFYAFVVSKLGLAIVVGAGVIGFCLGSARMANVFSFFWGTHSWWRRLGAYLDDKAEVVGTEYNVPVVALAIFLLVVVVFVIWKYAS